MFSLLNTHIIYRTIMACRVVGTMSNATTTTHVGTAHIFSSMAHGLRSRHQLTAWFSLLHNMCAIPPPADNTHAATAGDAAQAATTTGRDGSSNTRSAQSLDSDSEDDEEEKEKKKEDTKNQHTAGSGAVTTPRLLVQVPHVRLLPRASLAHALRATEDAWTRAVRLAALATQPQQTGQRIVAMLLARSSSGDARGAATTAEVLDLMHFLCLAPDIEDALKHALRETLFLDLKTCADNGLAAFRDVWFPLWQHLPASYVSHADMHLACATLAVAAEVIAEATAASPRSAAPTHAYVALRGVAQQSPATFEAWAAPLRGLPDHVRHVVHSVPLTQEQWRRATDQVPGFLKSGECVLVGLAALWCVQTVQPHLPNMLAAELHVPQWHARAWVEHLVAHVPRYCLMQGHDAAGPAAAAAGEAGEPPPWALVDLETGRTSFVVLSDDVRPDLARLPSTAPPQLRCWIQDRQFFFYPEARGEFLAVTKEQRITQLAKTTLLRHVHGAAGGILNPRVHARVAPWLPPTTAQRGVLRVLDHPRDVFAAYGLHPSPPPPPPPPQTNAAMASAAAAAAAMATADALLRMQQHPPPRPAVVRDNVVHHATTTTTRPSTSTHHQLLAWFRPRAVLYRRLASWNRQRLGLVAEVTLDPACARWFFARVARQLLQPWFEVARRCGMSVDSQLYLNAIWHQPQQQQQQQQQQPRKRKQQQQRREPPPCRAKILIVFSLKQLGRISVHGNKKHLTLRHAATLPWSLRLRQPHGTAAPPRCRPDRMQHETMQAYYQRLRAETIACTPQLHNRRMLFFAHDLFAGPAAAGGSFVAAPSPPIAVV